jgi:hypothetical protein
MHSSLMALAARLRRAAEESPDQKKTSSNTKPQ